MPSGTNWDKIGREERARRNGTVSIREEGEKVVRKKKKSKPITPFRPKFATLSRSAQEEIIQRMKRQTESIISKRREASLKRERKEQQKEQQ